MNNEFINYKNFTYLRINKNISDYFKENGYDFGVEEDDDDW